MASSTEGKSQIWPCVFGFIDSFALMCAVELRIPDIIHSHSDPITLSQISSSIGDSVNTIFLERIMKLLVQRGIFTVHHQYNNSDAAAEGEKVILYGLPLSSRSLLWELSSEPEEASYSSAAPMILVLKFLMSSFNNFSERVKGGVHGFKNVHGCEIWEYTAQNAEFNTLNKKTSEDHCQVISEAVISGYKDGFNNIGSLVDVGGGPGLMAAQIVKSYPHIKAINYDLPHVIKTAPPDLDGVTHLGGDMFESIPNAEAAIFKNVLSDWSDEAVIRIFKTCRKAIPEKTGKLIVIDIVLQSDGNSQLDHMRLEMDLAIQVALGGKYRTELEWKKLLTEGGFPTYNIIKIPATVSIIEASP